MCSFKGWRPNAFFFITNCIIINLKKKIFFEQYVFEYKPNWGKKLEEGVD